MNALLTGIYSTFASNSTLSTALSGGLYFTEAKQDVSYPYGVFFIVSNVPHYTFGEDMETPVVQFNIFHDSAADTTLHDISNKLKAVYDWSNLTVSGYTHVFMKREFERIIKVKGVWQASIQYRTELWKT